MKILIDEDVLYGYELFSQFGEVELFSGRNISSDLLKRADALIVRSITKVNSELLIDSNVRFVGTATSGVDHVDQDYLLGASITFSSASGCNAISVAEYVFSVLLWIAKRDGFSLFDKVIGIIGVGNIGGYLYRKLNFLGISTLLCDPLLSISNRCMEFCSLEKLVSEADVLTFHVPLILDGPYSTWHMVDFDFLEALSKDSILVNTSRGSIIDNFALLRILKFGKKLNVVLDVWENEPDLLLPLLKYIDIGTPHIAGSTLEGKIRGTIQVFDACRSFFGVSDLDYDTPFSLPPLHIFKIHEDLNEDILFFLSHFIYKVTVDDMMLRRSVGVFNAFDMLRKNYLLRREWSSIYIESSNMVFAERFKELGFSILGNK